MSFLTSLFCNHKWRLFSTRKNCKYERIEGCWYSQRIYITTEVSVCEKCGKKEVETYKSNF